MGRVVFWLGVGLLVIAAVRSISVTDTDRTGPEDEATHRALLRTIRTKTVDLHTADPSRPEVERGDFDLTAGETTSISAQDLPTERSLVLNLILPAALPGADALPARIIATDGSGELKLVGVVVANDRGRVRVEIESGWLSAGRYLIEIETTERAHLTLRRYRLEVR